MCSETTFGCLSLQQYKFLPLTKLSLQFVLPQWISIKEPAIIVIIILELSNNPAPITLVNVDRLLHTNSSPNKLMFATSTTNGINKLAVHYLKD
jgi:hypothetical protein